MQENLRKERVNVTTRVTMWGDEIDNHVDLIRRHHESGMTTKAQRHWELRNSARAINKDQRPIATLTRDTFIETSGSERSINGGRGLGDRSARTSSEALLNGALPSNIHRTQGRAERSASGSTTKLYILGFRYRSWLRRSARGLRSKP
jgi:hypothetical protein